MNQAEYRLQGTEVREAELVLLATPSEQAHFGPAGEVFALCYGMVRTWGLVEFEATARGVQPIAAPGRREAPCPSQLGARPGGWGSAAGAAGC